MAAEVKMDLRLNGLSTGKAPENMDEEADPTRSNGTHDNHVNGSSENHHDGDFDDGDDEMDGELGQISPSSRRRSTRASAIKAAEKIKLKDEFGVEPTEQNGIEDVNDEEEHNGETSEPSTKKRKLEDGSSLNQFSHRFGVKLEGEDVFVLSDDSEISSLNEVEVDTLKKAYEKIKAREPTEAQMAERLKLLKNAEAELRLEEAKLTMLRKIVKSVHDPNKNQGSMKEKVTCQDKAYKPVMATKSNTMPQNLSTKSKVAANQNMRNNNALLTLANLTPTQQQDLLRKALQLATADPQQAKQLLEALTKGGNNPAALAAALPTALLQKAATPQQSVPTPMQQTSSNIASSSVPVAPPTTSHTLPSSSSSSNLSVMNPLNAQTPAQRAVAARQAFRRQADQQLVQLAVPPKAPPHDINFIPNANQPDFCFLLGMDLVVQRVLKDKSVDAKVKERTYECEECSTDFTPSWKAIGPSENDLHLYCESCVHNAQKRKIRQDHTTSMKKIFNKFAAQEKDFEKQIADGKLEAALAEAAKAQAAQQAAQAAASRPTQTSTPQPKVNTSVVQTPPVPVPKTSTASVANSSNHHSTTPSSNSAKNRASQQQSSQINANMQSQLLAFTQMARSNPMAAAMMQPMLAQAMTNPTLMTQLMQMQWNPMMIAAAQAAAAQQARMQQNSTNMAAMNMLAQAVQNAQGGGSSGSSSSNPTHAAAMAALAALANPTSSASSVSANSMAQLGFPAALMSNPAMMQKLAAQFAASKKK